MTADRDGDGIPDALDACPDEPHFGTGDDGCHHLASFEALSAPPARPGVRAEVRSPVVPFGRGTLEVVEPLVLDAIARALLTTRARVDRVLIAGHAARFEDPIDAVALSVRRAQVVRLALIERGIDGARLVTRGFGDRCLGDERAGSVDLTDLEIDHDEVPGRLPCGATEIDLASIR